MCRCRHNSTQTTTTIDHPIFSILSTPTAYNSPDYLQITTKRNEIEMIFSSLYISVEMYVYLCAKGGGLKNNNNNNKNKSKCKVVVVVVIVVNGG